MHVKRNLTLLTDLYELTMMQGYYKNKNAENTVVFDVFYRENPFHGGYAICAGLDQVIEYIKDLHFDDEDIEYLRSMKVFDEDFLEYLNIFKRFQIYWGYICYSRGNSNFSKRADVKDYCTDITGTAC